MSPFSFNHCPTIKSILLFTVLLMIMSNASESIGQDLYYTFNIGTPPIYDGPEVHDELVCLVLPWGFPDNYGGELMVAWHGSTYADPNDSILDVFNCPDFVTYCYLNNIVLLAPLCKDPHHFGDRKAQKHCTYAISWLRNIVKNNCPNTPIDTEKIYMVGFSMGAGPALSYACRHTKKIHIDDYDLDLSKDVGYPVAGVILNAGGYDPANLCADWRDDMVYHKLCNWWNEPNPPYTNPGYPPWEPTSYYSFIHPIWPGPPVVDIETLWTGIKHPGYNYPRMIPQVNSAFPNLFYYQQISTLVLEGYKYNKNEPHNGYVRREDLSIGRNASHNLPVYITYSALDSTGHGGTKNQSDEMVAFLSSLSGVDLETAVFDLPSGPPSSVPGNKYHHWDMLADCMDPASGFVNPFDHLGLGAGLTPKKVSDQTPYSSAPGTDHAMDVLSDRGSYYWDQWWKPSGWNGEFYWAEVLEQDTIPTEPDPSYPDPYGNPHILIDYDTGEGDEHQLSRVRGYVKRSENKVYIEESYNVMRLGIDCGWQDPDNPGPMLDTTQERFKMDYYTTRKNKLPNSPVQNFGTQSLYFKNFLTDPTYMVRRSANPYVDGKVYWTWSTNKPGYNQHWVWFENANFQSPYDNCLKVYLTPTGSDDFIDIELEASFETYSMGLSIDSKKISKTQFYWIRIGGVNPSDDVYLLRTLEQFQKEEAVGNGQHLLILENGPRTTKMGPFHAYVGGGILLMQHTPTLDNGVYNFQAFVAGSGGSDWKISPLVGLELVD